MLEPAIDPTQVDQGTGGDPRALPRAGRRRARHRRPAGRGRDPARARRLVRPQRPERAVPAAPSGWQFPFDGDGMLHVVTLGQSRARYRNRWVLTKDLVAEREVGHALHAGTFDVGRAEPRTRTATARTGRTRTSSRTPAGSSRSGRAARPTSSRWRFGTVGEHTFDGALPGAMTAHPKIDPIWDELCCFRLLGRAAVPRCTASSRRAVRSAARVPIDIPRPVLMHDFAVTDQHVVFFDSPAVIDPAAAATGGPLVRWAARARHPHRRAVARRRAATASAGSRSRTASRCTS